MALTLLFPSGAGGRGRGGGIYFNHFIVVGAKPNRVRIQINLETSVLCIAGPRRYLSRSLCTLVVVRWDNLQKQSRMDVVKASCSVRDFLIRRMLTQNAYQIVSPFKSVG